MASDMVSLADGSSRGAEQPAPMVHHSFLRRSPVLVLSRKIGEVIIIGEGANQVRVVVTGIKGDKVRLGIEAPRNVSVHREEVWVAIQRDGELRAKEKGREAA